MRDDDSWALYVIAILTIVSVVWLAILFHEGTQELKLCRSVGFPGREAIGGETYCVRYEDGYIRVIPVREVVVGGD